MYILVYTTPCYNTELFVVPYIDCYDSDGVCHPIAKTFIKNCSQCIYPDNGCVIECDPLLCPSMPNNCNRIVPTSDGCCMTCATSEGTHTHTHRVDIYL